MPPLVFVAVRASSKQHRAVEDQLLTTARTAFLTTALLLETVEEKMHIRCSF